MPGIAPGGCNRRDKLSGDIDLGQNLASSDREFESTPRGDREIPHDASWKTETHLQVCKGDMEFESQ